MINDSILLSQDEKGENQKLKKKYLITISAVFALVCICIVLIFGSSYTIKADLPANVTDIDQINVTIENDCVKIENQSIKNGTLYLTLKSVHKGKSSIDIVCLGDKYIYNKVFVHSFGVITEQIFLGRSTGSIVISILITIYLALVLLARIYIYRNDVRENMYRYQNVKNIGLIIYLSSVVIGQIVSIFSCGGIIKTANDILNSVSTFSIIALPIAFILFVLVTLSNIVLMKKEGRNWRNMLGFFFRADCLYMLHNT